MITVSNSEGGPDPNGVDPLAADEPRELNFSSLGKGSLIGPPSSNATEPSSHLTQRWRELDSNFRFRGRKASV